MSLRTIRFLGDGAQVWWLPFAQKKMSSIVYEILHDNRARVGERYD